jgi:DUF1680 family protein
MWDENDVWVNQFGDSVLSDGDIKVSQKTEYPKSGKVVITAEGTKNVRVRVPGWCDRFTASRKYTMEKGYAVFKGEGEIALDFEMRPKLMKSDFRVRDNRGRVAVQYGPVVYCAENIDNGDVHSLCIDAVNPEWESEVCETCGCMKLSVNGFRLGEQLEGLHSELNPALEPIRIKLIPYHIFANRECTGMTVYLWYR